MVLSSLGCLFLWLGWFGFNGGSLLSADTSLASIIFKTTIAAAFGGIVSSIIARIYEGISQPDHIINGILAGLVAITAGCHVVSDVGAIVIGSIAGIVFQLGRVCMLKLHLDDVVDAISVHYFSGVWGTIAVAFFATDKYLKNASMWEQLIVQLQGVVIIFLWAFGVSFVLLKLLNTLVCLRVSKKDEITGLNIAEHGVSFGTGVLLNRLKDLVEGQKDLTKRLNIEPGDESFDLAMYFNQFLDNIHDLVKNIKDHSNALANESDNMHNIAITMQGNSHSMYKGSEVITDSNGGVVKDVKNITKLADNINSHINSVSKSARQMSGNITTISGAVYQLSTSVDDIARQSKSASDTANDAHSMMEKARHAMKSLIGTSEKIDEISLMISRIASQTSMLSFNATIEAKAAGDAGKGFAVIAEEVRNLANSTATATETISKRVEELKSSELELSEIIHETSEIINTVDEAMLAISRSTEEHMYATNQISENILQTADHAGEISETIDSISLKSMEVKESAHEASRHVIKSQNTIEEFSGGTKRNLDNSTELGKSSFSVNNISHLLDLSSKEYKT